MEKIIFDFMNQANLSRWRRSAIAGQLFFSGRLVPKKQRIKIFASGFVSRRKEYLTYGNKYSLVKSYGNSQSVVQRYIDILFQDIWNL